MIDNSKFLLYFRRVFPIKHPMEAFEYITCWPHRIHRKFKNRGVFWISLTIYNARGRYLKQPLKVICTVLPFIGLIEHTPRMRTPWLPWVPIKSVWYHATISDPIEHSPPLARSLLGSHHSSSWYVLDYWQEIMSKLVNDMKRKSANLSRKKIWYVLSPTNSRTIEMDLTRKKPMFPLNKFNITAQR